MKKVIAFFAMWALATCVLTVTGFIAPLAVVVALAPAVFVASVVRSSSGSPVNRPFTAPGAPPLTATYASDTLALDVPGRRLWMRDLNGRTLIVDLIEVAAWEHTWTDTSNLWGARSRIRNQLHFRLRRLDVPAVTVAFRRYSDGFNGNQNYQEAADWQARLTNLING